MIRHISLAFSPLLLVFLVGCSPYVEDFYYVPRPAVAQVFAVQPPPQPQAPSTQPAPPAAGSPQAAPGGTTPQSASTPVVTTYASVVGVFRGDRSQGIPESVQVRFRIDNRGAETAIYQPQTLELITASLLRFPPPVMRPPGEIAVPPGQSAIVDAYFPFPPGRFWQNTDMGTLKVDWVTEVGGHPVSQGVDFYRIFPGYYYPHYWGYPGPYVTVGGVFVFRHR